jgi:hypothetical protein
MKTPRAQLTETPRSGRLDSTFRSGRQVPAWSRELNPGLVYFGIHCVCSTDGYGHEEVRRAPATVSRLSPFGNPPRHDLVWSGYSMFWRPACPQNVCPFRLQGRLRLHQWPESLWPRVRGETTGSPKYRTVGESQSVLIIINSMISPCTRTTAAALQVSVGCEVMVEEWREVSRLAYLSSFIARCAQILMS